MLWTNVSIFLEKFVIILHLKSSPLGASCKLLKPQDLFLVSMGPSFSPRFDEIFTEASRIASLAECHLALNLLVANPNGK